MFRTASALFLLSTLPSFADVIPADSRVMAATVFPSSATVVRSAAFSAEAGQHSVVIDDLPLHFDASSLRVSGAGDAAFQIVSVDHRLTRMPPQDPRLSPEWQALEAEIAVMETEVERRFAERRLLEMQVEVAQGRLRMVETLMQREPQDMVDSVDQGADPADWAATIEMLVGQMDIALRAQLSAEEGMRPLDQEIADLRQEIARLRQEQVSVQLPAQDRSVATVSLSLDQPVSGVLQLEYRVGGAGWQPIYDVRLEQGGEADLAIERHARVWQSTGEAWEDVTLTLSTARPSGALAAPELGEQIAHIWDRERTEMLGDTAFGAAEQATPEVTDQLESRVQGVLAPPVVAGLAQTRAEVHGQTVVYVLPGQMDVDGDGTTRQALIDTDRLEVTPSARSAPRFDPQAYLYAAFDNGFDGPLLPGEASVYLDGAFVGETVMPMVAEGETVELPFGAIDGLLVETAVVDREAGDYGVFATTLTRTERYSLRVESVLGYPLELTVLDRMPVSEDEDLVIEMTASQAPTEQDVGGQRGVVAWTQEVPEGGVVEIEFGYEMQWPGAAELILN